MRAKQRHAQDVAAQQFADLIGILPIMAFSVRPDGWTDFVSDSWQEYSGFSLEATTGGGWHATVQASREKSEFMEDYRLLLADGTLKHVHVIGHPVLNGTGDVVEYVGTAVDVTERKLAEEEHERLRQLEADLAHINRVSMMGELAASLAHDIKQPLTGAVMSANACERWLRRDPPAVSEASEAASRMTNNVMRAAEIIDRVRSLYTRGTPRREPVDLNDLVEEMIGLLYPTANRRAISIRTDLDARLPMITADRVQLQQVLMNLMLNSIEAMKETGGRLTVRSKTTADGQILIAVSDSGIGLPEQEPERVFEAFFTTKSQGTGMGLSISRRIIDAHGGRLWASNNPGRGTTFQFSLPVEIPAEESAATVIPEAVVG
jgi:PAS domain S-box-containing protein